MAKIMEETGGAGQAFTLEIDPAIVRPAPGADTGDTRPALAPADLPAPESPAARKGGGLRRVALIAAGAVVLLGAAYFGHQWWSVGRFIVSTDDAYVGADISTVTSKITGYVQSVPAPDNAHVKAGDPLVVLDPADYQNALDRAEAQAATGEATVERIAQQILAGEATVKSAAAQLASARAVADNAETQFNRVNTLAGNGFATAAARDTARTARDQAVQAVIAADAALASARANVGVLNAQKVEAERGLDQYRLARDQAKLNLDHTVVRAPFAGVVGNGAAEPGEFVQPGQRLLALVPLDAVYVDANFKETQLADIRPGETVTIAVDAWPGRDIEGTVESIAPASGSQFSLLPPDNATGNFTKVVQRVPVRIRLPADVVAEGVIRPGMSVTADIDIRTGGSAMAAK
jgi:membrane fusion protein (multidrug efflux system)